MTARTGLANLIDTLGGMTNAGTADYTLGTAVYWDGDQMQRVLDRHRMDVVRDQLVPNPYHASGGTLNYYEYRSHFGNFEQTTGGTSIFLVEDSTGADQGTAGYSVDYERGIVTFTTDRQGSVYYLTGRSYDLNAAAADIWRIKAGHVASGYDVRTDNTTLSRSQLKKQYLEMAAEYSIAAPVHSVSIGRGDVP